MSDNHVTEQEKLEMRSFVANTCYSFKWKATIHVLKKIKAIHKSLSKAHGNKKSLIAVLRDMLQLIWKHRAWIDAYNNTDFFVEDYFVERLYLKGRLMSDYPMLYEGIRAMAYASIPSNKKLHEINDKDTCWSFMNKKGFPLPSRLGHLTVEHESLIWQTPDNKCKTIQDLLQEHPMVFIKPADGMQGQCCFRLAKGDSANLFQLNSDTVTEKQLLHQITGDLLIEEVLTNHKDIEALHPQSLNTVRLITLRHPGGRYELFRAFLRIGTGNMTVDNYNKGAIGVMINNNGQLKGIGITQDYTQSPYTSHPDSHIFFDSFQLPFWQETTELVLAMHKKCGRICGIGWDIAITPSGPVLVEANPYFGFGMLLGHGIPCRQLLDSEFIPLATKNIQNIYNL